MTTAKQKYIVGEFVLYRNPRMGFTPALNKIDEGFQVCRVTKVVDGWLGHFVAIRVLNETSGIETINPNYPKITREEAEALLLG